MYSHSYTEECRRLIQAFEKTQYIMLRLDIINAEKEFLIEIVKIRQLIKPMSIALQEKEFAVKRDQTLLLKQIERLLMFLKEMEGHIKGFSQNNSPAEKEIIFYFERQHLFKNIFHRHIDDFAQLTG